jgi:hypothetical protein
MGEYPDAEGSLGLQLLTQTTTPGLGIRGYVRGHPPRQAPA